MMNTPKAKPCKHCKQPTNNKIGLRYLCNIDHAIAFTKSEAERKQTKQKAEQRKNERAAIKAEKQRIKPLSKWLSEAQAEFNRYIRLRDSEVSCISCGAVTAGQWDCSHYRSRGAASHLRFSEINCNRACSVCNQHYSGRIVDYRIGLIRKVGEAAVIELENDNKPHKWTIEEVAAIKKEYAAKCRELQSHAGT